MPATESLRRSYFASATTTAIALTFFFGVGFAGGAVYKLYFGDETAPQIADRADPAAIPPPVSAGSVQNLAAITPSEADKAASDSARAEPPIPSSLPPAPTKTRPHAPAATVAQAAAPPPASKQASRAAPVAPPSPAPEGETAVARPDAQPETQASPQRPATIPPKKPAMAAKAQDAPSPPRAVAQRVPATASGNSAPPFRVQFGVFADEDNARRMQWAIEATGFKIDVSREQGPSGRSLFFVRSPSYADYASALNAAQTVHDRAQHLVNPISIDYAILGNRSAPEQRAQMP